jgi:hypothetical protein
MVFAGLREVGAAKGVALSPRACQSMVPEIRLEIIISDRLSEIIPSRLRDGEGTWQTGFKSATRTEN